MRVMSLTAALILSAAVAEAGAPVPPPISSDTETRAFLGLNWTFGSRGSVPEAVAGVARVKTQSDGDSEGAKLSLHMPIGNDGLSFGKVKLAGVFGEHDRMFEAGVGFGQSSFFGTAGLWAPHVNLGLDLGLGGGFDGYVGINTLGKWDVP